MKYVVNKIQRTFSNKLFLLISVTVIAGVMGFVGVQRLQSAKEKPQSKSCQQAIVCVALEQQGMNPDTITVKLGEYVQFNSADGKTHNISLGSGANADGQMGHEQGTAAHAAHDAPKAPVANQSSGEFKSDEGWRVQFNKTGTYKLHDHYNPKLEILVVVYEPGADNKITN